MKPDNNKWKRPVPHRSEPQRQWSAQVINQQRKNMQHVFENLSGAAKGASMGYKVSEDQMNQGKEHAKHYGTPGAGTDAFGWGGISSLHPESFYAVSERLMKDAMLWFEFVARNTQKTAEFIRPQNTGSAAAVNSSGFVTSVVSEQPVEISFTPQPGSEGRPLGVHELRAVEPDSPGIAGIEVSFAEGQWRVSIQVKRGQPSGLYTGIVFDREDGSIRGSLAVAVNKG